MALRRLFRVQMGSVARVVRSLRARGTPRTQSGLVLFFGVLFGSACGPTAGMREDLEAARQALTSPDWVVKIQAIKTLHAAGSAAGDAASDVSSLLEEDDGHDDVLERLTRELAARTLGDLGRRDPRVVSALVRGLEDESSAVRGTCARSIAKLQIPGSEVAIAIGRLLDRVDGDEGAALGALAKLGPSAAAAVPAITRYLVATRDPFGTYPLMALGRLAEGSVPTLVQLLEDPLADLDMLAGVTGTLAKMGGAAGSAIPALKAAAEAGVEGAQYAMDAIRAASMDNPK